MKKKSLLLILLMALMAPWAAKGQATLTVYDGSSESEFMPLYAYSGDTEGTTSEFIIPASDLTALTGSTITQLTFYLTQQGSKTWTATYQVYLKEVEGTTLSSNYGPDVSTVVYTGTINGKVDETTIVFDNSYVYNGGNLLIGTYVYTEGAWDSSGKFKGTEVTGAAYLSGDWGGYNTGVVDFIPKTTFTYLTTDPWITLTPNTASVLTGFTKELTASYGNVTGTPTITYSSDDESVATVTGSGTSATVTAVAPGTATITATMTYNATDYTATCDITVEDPSYCEPSFDSSSSDYGMYITNFTTDAGINNSTGFSTGGYGDYYDTQASEIEAGETLNFSVSQGSSYAFGYAIWVDWNNDYEFSSDERVAVTSSTTTTSWSDSFTVASTTPAGDYRMRVLAQYYTASPSDPCISVYYGEGEDYKLKVAAFNPYQKPVNLHLTNLEATTATLAWEAPNTDVQSYKYQYREEGGTWNALTSTTALSAPLADLTGNTTYEFQVQAIYAGNNESNFVSKTFTTECNPYSINPTAYQYGFEDVSDMDCWTLTNVTSGGVASNSWASSNLGYEPARTGNNFWVFLYVDYPATNPDYQTLISPRLTDLPANGVHVEFYYVKDLDGSGEETFRVGYSTTDKNLSSFTWGTEITNASTEYQRFSANYPQETKYVAVQHTSDDQYYLFLDDFTFEGAADCLEPSDVLADDITTTGASINWTAGGEEPAWDMYVTTDGTIVPDDGTTPTYANISTKPYPLTPLTPATTYYVYVRAACSSTETSAWSSPGIFHTECEGMDLPYGPYGFEDGALSVCWNVINTNTSYNSVSVSASNANLGTHCLSFFRGSTTGDLVAVLPEVGAYDLSDYQFEFSAKGSYAGYEITIGIMTDPDDLTTFVAQGDVITTTTSYAEHKVRFNEYTGSGKYVAIKVVRPSTVTYGTIYVDDIAINPIPSCIEPSGLAVSDETAHGATFGWTAGGSETEWHLYISDDPTAPADDIDLSKVTVANSNPFTMTTGLDPETAYYVWVRTNCGGTDGYSMWVGPETFTTGIACPAPTGLAYSEVTAHTAKLSWDGTSDSYNVWYRTAATMSNPIFNETFETSSLPTGWGRSSTALTDDVLNGTTPINSYSGGWVNTSYGLGQYNWKMNIYSTGKYWLITPNITLDAKNTLNFDAAITAYNSNNAPTSSNMANANSRFVVLITTDDQATWTILREWNNTGSADVLNNISNTGNNFSIDLTAYAGETVKIAFYGGQTSSGPDCDLHIDNVLIGTPIEAGEWTKKTADASPYVATVLLAETKYEAQVQGNCGSEGTSQWTSSVFFTTDIACPAPSSLTASNPTSSSFDLQWTNGGAEYWVLAYKVDGAADFTELDLNVSDVTEEAGLITYTLTGLDPETDYIVKVRDNCEPSYAGDGQSEWTAEVNYSTIAACSALNPVVSDITHHNATVNWEGESADGFTVKYRTAALVSNESPVFSEQFNTTSSTPPTGWTSFRGLVDKVIDGTATLTTTTSGWYCDNTNALATLNIYGTSVNYWLVTPEVTLTTDLALSFDMALTDYGNANALDNPTAQLDDRFVVLVFADDAWHILREWNNSGSVYVYNNIATTGEKAVVDLSAYNGKTVKIAFYGESTANGGDNDFHIDNVLIGTPTAAGDWNDIPASTTTAEITGLTAGTLYDVKVVTGCTPSMETEIISINTVSSTTKHLLAEGNWNDGTKWMDAEFPTTDDIAILHANVTIPAGTQASVNSILIGGTPEPAITIKDGGELYHTTTVNRVTMEKEITGATTWGEGNGASDGWYVISNPLSYTSLTPTSTTYVTNLAPAAVASVPQFDLYKYSESNMNWYSYNAHLSSSSSYYLTRGMGFLYARKETATISFNTTTSYYLPVADVTPSLTYTAANGDMAGWNLLGNPFSHSITWDNLETNNINDAGYYRMENGAWIVDAEGHGQADKNSIKPMEGFLVKATAASPTITIKNVAASSKGRANNDFLAFTVANSNYSDITYAMFSDGEGLEKINHRNTNVPMVYIPQDGERYAIATMGDETDMFNLNFKAMTTGKYTLSYKAEGSYDYLHVIDRITGEDVDMLIDGEYSFMASAGDNENRFIVKLRYNANGNFENDIFAYQNGDEIIVNGEGELQIFDVMGRFVTSMEVNGSERISAEQYSSAVYIFRLVGNDVKTQKIVVR